MAVYLQVLNGYGKPSRILSVASLSAELKVCTWLPFEQRRPIWSTPVWVCRWAAVHSKPRLYKICSPDPSQEHHASSHGTKGRVLACGFGNPVDNDRGTRSCFYVSRSNHLGLAKWEMQWSGTIPLVPSSFPLLIRDQHAFWNYIEVTNIITDLALIVLPLIMISGIRTSITRKSSIFSFFALRVL